MILHRARHPISMLGITGLLLALLVAVETWAPLLVNMRVLVFIDNVAALHIAATGTSRASDLARLAHALWRRLSSLRVDARFFWIPSAFNCADRPSCGRLDSAL